MILIFFEISHNCFFKKIIDWVYGSQDHGWLLVHGALMIMGSAAPPRLERSW
jgi:hypothetical protein